MLKGLNSALFLQRLLLSLLVFSAMPTSVVVAASGTLVMSKQTTGNFVLLARSKGRDYFELLGGTNEIAASLSNEIPSAESDYETALRETVEESRGYFGRRGLLLVSDPLKWRIEVELEYPTRQSYLQEHQFQCGNFGRRSLEPGPLFVCHFLQSREHGQFV